MARIQKRKLTPKTVRTNTPIKTYERKAIRDAFMTDEPVRRIAHRFGVDPGSVYYHCADLIEARGARRIPQPPRAPKRPSKTSLPPKQLFVKQAS